MSEKLLSDGHPCMLGAVSETSGLICAFLETTVASEAYTVGINEGKQDQKLHSDRYLTLRKTVY
jgi:hypothetical protein